MYSRYNRDYVKQKAIHHGETLFIRQAKTGLEGRDVIVDGENKTIMIVQRHTNPLHQGLLDKKAKFLNSAGKYFHIGNLIEIPEENMVYLAVTKPESTGVYSEYRIRPAMDKAIIGKQTLDKITNDIPIENSILADGLLYDETSYLNSSTVFEDNSMKALCVQYNNNTRNIQLFDDIFVNNIHYNIVKIDDDVLKRYDNDFGVIQLVIYKTPYFNLYKKNVVTGDEIPIHGVVQYARVKDKKLNAISKELLCNYNTVTQGDYIRYEFDRGNTGKIEEEIYIVYNEPVFYDGYDICLILRCFNSFKLLDDNGIPVSIPYYFEDNRTRIDKTVDIDRVKDFNSSFCIIVQDNAITRKLINRKVSRLILKQSAYEITGISDLDEGLLFIGLELDKHDNYNDKQGVADYTSQINKLQSDFTSPDTVYINGEDRIYKGITWEYTLNNLKTDDIPIWSVDNDSIDITIVDKKCLLKIKHKLPMGTKFKLKSTIGVTDYEKEIMIE